MRREQEKNDEKLKNYDNKLKECKIIRVLSSKQFLKYIELGRFSMMSYQIFRGFRDLIRFVTKVVWRKSSDFEHARLSRTLLFLINYQAS